MIKEHNGIKYQVSWKHLTKTDQFTTIQYLADNFKMDKKSLLELPDFKAVTVCYLREDKERPIDTEPVAIGFAYCSELDQFNRKVGRRISLTRALKNAEYDRKLRSIIWKATDLHVEKNKKCQEKNQKPQQPQE